MDIKIERKGKAKGTVGWLAENADRVVMANRRAVLLMKDGPVIPLVEHDPYGVADRHPECDRYELVERVNFGPSRNCLDYVVTEACWETITQLAEQVRADMIASEDQEVAIEFEIKEIN